MQDFTIERVGILNLDFTGDLIGHSGGPKPQVKIYRTKAGHYVGQLVADSERSNAANFNTPQEVINWFKGKSNGQINAVVQAAIEDAAMKDGEFKKAWNQHID